MKNGKKLKKGFIKPLLQAFRLLLNFSGPAVLQKILHIINDMKFLHLLSSLNNFSSTFDLERIWFSTRLLTRQHPLKIDLEKEAPVIRGVCMVVWGFRWGLGWSQMIEIEVGDSLKVS